jgi:hypothetical protein
LGGKLEVIGTGDKGAALTSCIRNLRAVFELAYMHSCARRDIDRQHIQDREKWKRETAQKIKETKIQMMKLTGWWGQEGGSLE